MWNYLTPVFYSIEIIPASLQTIFKLNPLYHYLTSARQIVLYGTAPSLTTLLLLAGMSFGMLALGSIVFKKNQDKFIYYV